MKDLQERDTSMIREVICGECGAAMRLKDSRYGQFWGCSRYPKCDGTHGAHPDGSPHGIPANKATKLARIEAHAAFDSLWNGGGMKRKQAYRWMAEAMGLGKDAAHISMFDAEQCATLVRLVRERQPITPASRSDEN